MKIKILLLTLTLATLTNSYGARTIKIPPIDTPTGWTEKDFACTAGIYRKFSFVNLHSENVTLTIKIKNIGLAFGVCNAAAYGGNWSAPVPGTTCRGYSPDFSGLTYNEDITVPANGSTNYVARVLCKTSSVNGVSDCRRVDSDYTYGNGVTMEHDKTITVSLATTDIELVVNSDKGAIIGSLVAMVENGCAEFKSNIRYNLPINGGRAF